MQRKSLFKAGGIVAIAALLVVSGVFMWQQPYFFAQNSSASGKKVGTIVVLTPQNFDSFKTEFPSQIAKNYTTGTTMKFNTPDQDFSTEFLRQQATTPVNTLTLPLANKAAFVIILPNTNFLPSGHNGSLTTTIQQQIQTDIASFMTFLQNRPGVFPQGFSVYIAISATPTDTYTTNALCLGDFENTRISALAANLETAYPGKIHLVNTKSLAGKVKNCVPTAEGQKELTILVSQAIAAFE